MGFVRIRHGSDSAIIDAAPGRMRFRTYSSAAGFLDDLSPRRLSLTWFDSDWRHEIIPGVEQFCHRLLSLMQCRHQKLTSNYITEDRAFDSLNSSSPFISILDHWRTMSGEFVIDEYPDLIHGPLQSKFTVGQYDQGSGRLVFSKIGAGIKVFKPKATAQIIGKPVDEVPDIAYGRAISNDWRIAMLRDEPLLLDIDALILDPLGGPTKRRQYTRLMLPVREQSGTVSLLSASLSNRDIDFRGESLVSAP